MVPISKRALLLSSAVGFSILSLIVIMESTKSKRMENRKALEELIYFDEEMVSAQSWNRRVEESRDIKYKSKDYFALLDKGLLEKDQFLLMGVQKFLAKQKNLEAKYRRALEKMVEYGIESEDTIPKNAFMRGIPSQNVDHNPYIVELALGVLLDLPGEKTEELVRRVVLEGDPNMVTAAMINLARHRPENMNETLAEFVEKRSVSDQYKDSIELAQFLLEGGEVEWLD